MKFRKKPVVIDAIQFTEESLPEVIEFLGDALIGMSNGLLYISTLEGFHEASVGDYIICGVAGEFYPCKPDIFEQTYDPVME